MSWRAAGLSGRSAMISVGMGVGASYNNRRLKCPSDRKFVQDDRTTRTSMMATELQEFITFFAEYPQEVGALLDGLTPDGLNWRPLATGDQDVSNSLAVVVTHAAGSLEDWGRQVAGGRARAGA